MDAPTYVALGGIVLALVTSLTVPLLKFRLAMRQDRNRWLREQRVQLYEEILTDAQARREEAMWSMFGEKAREVADERMAGLRLTPAQGPVLHSKVALIASQAVVRQLEHFDKAVSQIRDSVLTTDEQRAAGWNVLNGAYQRLQNLIRSEVGVEQLHHDGRQLPKMKEA